MSNGSLASLSYISTARSDLTGSDFQNILDAAIKRNDKLGLTGLLAFNGLNFMQTLEGSIGELNCCVRLIQEDRRHDGMVIFDRHQAPRREFPDWKMAGIILDSKGLDRSRALNEMLSSEWITSETRKHFKSFESFGRETR